MRFSGATSERPASTSSMGATEPEFVTPRSLALGKFCSTSGSAPAPEKEAIVMPGWLKSSTLVAFVNFGFDASPNMQTLVAEYSTKSTTFRRSAVSASGLIVMST
ncbi:hypothetical protein G6F32_017289 [Rhizopus arrhizus]|nr:hypothetical protein G6F32_017289 [Rhizopus arrhizus]